MVRVVAITGASAGIGRATALRLARNGDALLICARRSDQLHAVADEIRAAGGQAVPIVADVTRVSEMDRFIAAAVDRFGRVDVILCNAGFGIAGTIDDVTPDQMRELVDINYMGTFYATRAAMPVFRRQGAGHIRRRHFNQVDILDPHAALSERFEQEQPLIGKAIGDSNRLPF